MRNRLMNLAAILVLLIGGGSVGAASPALATTACTSAVNSFDGGHLSGQTLYSVAATLGMPNVPGLCGDTNSVSALWAMVASGTSPNTLGYAQSGYVHWQKYSTNYFFAEFHHPNAIGDWYKQGSVATSGVNYSENYDFSNGVINMHVGSTVLLTTDFDPILYWGSPWEAEWYAETHEYGDDVPGSSSNPAYVSSLEIQTCRSCGLTTPSGVQLYNNNSRYDEGWDTTNSKFHVYTK